MHEHRTMDMVDNAERESERPMERVSEWTQFRRCNVAILVHIEFEWLSNEHMRNVKRYGYFVRWLRRQQRRPWRQRPRQRTENEWRWFPCRPQRIFSTSNGFSRHKKTMACTHHQPSKCFAQAYSIYLCFSLLTLTHSHIRIHIISTINRYIHCRNQIKGALCVWDTRYSLNSSLQRVNSPV